jgi:hypothetical protein
MRRNTNPSNMVVPRPMNNAGQKQTIDPMEKIDSLFCRCVKVKRGLKLKIVTAILGIAVFMERYTFIISVYKTKYFGYMLILLVILLNVIF